MKRLSPPTLNADVVISACVATIANADLQDRLSAVVPDVVAGEGDYRHRGTAGQLQTIGGSGNIAGQITTAEMVWVYDNKLSRKGDNARRLYDILKSAPKIRHLPLLLAAKSSNS